MNRYIFVIKHLIQHIRSHMPNDDSISDEDITVRLHLCKLENDIINSAIHFVVKYTNADDSAAIAFIDSLKTYKKINQEIIDLIESNKTN